ncbi:ABC transporter permease subunit [Curvibacter sp. CHRR-16]|uniref:amino acid ABC transporter permease n=1 Tax=Curvibacter sp. CHRR-16 TaxID=2835872 RepID=UPI001BD938D4|nr:ABC transporter permease subunit [Curvibacter sp. CHRR-16]MBT0570683.1 ABC transporter permease subunit [Curvibacter sp. CHRR-16]
MTKVSDAAQSRPPTPQRHWHTVSLQLVVLVVVVGLLGWFVFNAWSNLAARHIGSGFGFLQDTAGFSISESIVAYEIGDSTLRAFAVGMVNTMRAAIPAIVLASLLGFTVGVGLISRNALVRSVARCYVDVVRNVPLLVQVLMWYFVITETLPDSADPIALGSAAFISKGGLAVAIPDAPWYVVLVLLVATLLIPAAVWRFSSMQRMAWRALWQLVVCAALVGLWVLQPAGWELPSQGAFGVAGGAALSPEWLSVVAALTLYSGAYCAEIVRGGIQAVHKGQWEACHALSMSRAQMLVRVILPQSLRVIVPPYTSLIMNTLKGSSLAVAVGYPDIVSITTTSMNQNGQAIECVAIIALVYLTLNLCTALVMGWVNKRVQLRER